MREDDSSQRYGVLVVLSGPSGAGKTTVYRSVLNEHSDIRFSVSCTTRPKRPGEVDGVDYHFISTDAFKKHVDQDDFLEYASVHDNLYGTLRQDVEENILKGIDVLLDIDVQGARQVRRAARGSVLESAAVFVFCGPPSYDALKERLARRGTDSPDIIKRRLENAVTELAAWREYDYLVVNDVVEDAVARLDAIVRAARSRTWQFQQEPWTAPEAADGQAS